MDDDLTQIMKNGARELSGYSRPALADSVRARGDQRHHRRTIGSVGLALTAVLVVSGLIGASSLRGHSATPGTSPSPAPHPSKSFGEGRPQAACTTAQLAITHSVLSGHSGHSDVAIIFRNKGSITCVLDGYPEVTPLDANGKKGPSVEHTVGTFDPPSSVSLAPGQVASAIYEGWNFSPDYSACPVYFSTLRVAPPGSDDTVDVDMKAVGYGPCAVLQVHPIVAGAGPLPSEP